MSSISGRFGDATVQHMLSDDWQLWATHVDASAFRSSLPCPGGRTIQGSKSPSPGLNSRCRTPPIFAEQKGTGTSLRFYLPVYATLPPPLAMFELNCSADHACVTSAKGWSIMAQREKLTEKLVRAAEPRTGIYQVFDEDVRGFSLRIFSSGSRHLALDYRV